jgi:hypothetical protein
MRSGVLQHFHLIISAANDATVLRDYRADRHFVAGRGFGREAQSFAHQRLVVAKEQIHLGRIRPHTEKSVNQGNNEKLWRFAGVSLEGAVIVTEKEKNGRYYGRSVTKSRILNDKAAALAGSTVLRKAAGP